MSQPIQCCIAGGGPAGMMLGVLLARAGSRVTVLEKHADFLRDFRGDTIHPSTLEIMHELGWLDDFLKLPHQKVHRLSVLFGTTAIELADFSHLRVHAPYIAMMPQWDFLNFLAGQGQRYPGFDLRMTAEATDLIEADGTIVGVRGHQAGTPFEIRADLIVAADGRGSVLRARSNLPIDDFGAPMDALWFQVPRLADDTAETMARIDRGAVFVMLNRGDTWQCAYVIPKGANDAVRAEGLAAFQARVKRCAPFVGDRVSGIASFDDVKLLQVQVNRLRRWWRPGFLCIGDAAHAMSPIGGVGVNLAVQDAVAAANLLAQPLRELREGQRGRLGTAELAAIERRRAWPARVTQTLQLAMQRQIIAPVLAAGEGPLRLPTVLRLLQWVPILRRLPARMIGLGVRREHVSPAIMGA